MNNKPQGTILVTVLFLTMLIAWMTLLMQQSAWLELKMSTLFGHQSVKSDYIHCTEIEQQIAKP